LTALAFWSWFENSHGRLQWNTDDEREAVLDEILEVLHEYSTGLWFEIGGHPEGPKELIISAEGDSDYFAEVVSLIAQAPKLDGWKFIAFKPPQGFEFTTTYEDVHVDPAQCWFLPLDSSSDPKSLGLRVAVADFNENKAKAFTTAVYLVLDAGLGELRAGTCINYIEVVAVPSNPQDEGFIELTELDQFITWREAKRSEA
jgi:hypothetical protein